MEQIHFDARVLPSRDAFDHWRVGVSDFKLTMLDPTRSFDGVSTITSLAGVLISESHLPALRFQRTAAMALADGHDMWSLSLVLSGGMTLTFDGIEAEIAPGGIALLSHTRPADIRTLPGRTIVLAIPGTMLLGVDPAATHGALETTAETALLATCLQALCAALPALQPDAALPARRALIALIQAAVGTIGEPRPGGRGDRKLRAQAVQHILADLRAPTDSVSLCEALAVSRSALYRALARDGGLRPLLRRLRLQEAHRMLSDPQESRGIQQIATAVGYADSALFSRHFAADFGYSAAAFRARRQVPPMIDPDAPDIPSGFRSATERMAGRPAPG